LKIKTGIGFDIHRLVDGHNLILGGIEIPFSKGLKGHSDGDCLVHAIIDALLGALGLMDIGHQFPDTDEKYKGIRSTVLLDEVMTMMQERGGRIVNVDSVIVAEQPRLGEHISSMKTTLCPILGIAETDLGIKAKSHEGIGPLGHGEAVAAWATVLVKFEES
jgi:2-C-methyl-D-erythritol 2,4-cyclodiphosphate synthase